MQVLHWQKPVEARGGWQGPMLLAAVQLKRHVGWLLGDYSSWMV